MNIAKTNNNKKRFSVIQFLKLPYPEIDDYVCVPNFWIMINKGDKKVIVAYPKEAPFLTRNRVKGRENLPKNFEFFTGFVKYESDFYHEAEMWIAARKDDRPVDGNDINYNQQNHSQNDQQQPTLDSKLRSSTSVSPSSSKTNKPRMKPNDNPRKPISPGTKDIKKKPHPHPEKSTTATNDKNDTEQYIQPQITKGKKSPAKPSPPNINQSSSSEHSGDKELSPVCQCHKQERCIPKINVKEPIEVIDNNQEDHAEVTKGSISPVIQVPAIASNKCCKSKSINRSEIARIGKSIQKYGTRVKMPEYLNVNRQITDIQINKESTPPTAHPSNTSNQHMPYLTANQNSFATFPPLEMQVGTSSDVNKNAQRIYATSTSDNSTNRSSEQFKDAVDKKLRVENIANKIDTDVHKLSNSTNQPSPLLNRLMTEQVPPSTQTYLQEVPRISEQHNGRPTEDTTIDHSALLPSIPMNASSVQNQTLTNVPPRHFEKSHQPKYHPSYQAYLQQNMRSQDILRRPEQAQSIGHGVHYQNAMINETYAVQNPPNLANQLDPRSYNSQYLPINQDFLLQEQRRQELLRRSTQSSYTDQSPYSRGIPKNVPSVVRYSWNQYHPVVGRLYQPKLYPGLPDPRQDPRTSTIPYDISVNANSNSRSNNQMPDRQKVTKKRPSDMPHISNLAKKSHTDARLKYLVDELYTEFRLIGEVSEQNYNSQTAVTQNITVEPTPAMQNIELQPTHSSDRCHEGQFTLACENRVYQNPCTKKMVVDQSTETNSSDDETNISSTIESKPRIVMDQSCQTDECSMEEPLPPDQEFASDHEVATNQENKSCLEIVLSYQPSSEKATVAAIKDVDHNEESKSLENDTKNIPMAIQNPTTSVNELMNGTTIAKNQTLDVLATFFNELTVNMANTCDIFNNLHNSIRKSADKCKQLSDMLNTLTPKVEQVTDEKQNGVENRRNSSNRDVNNRTTVDEAIKQNTDHRRSFAFPPDHDPEDIRWTLKHRIPMPGLVELMPSTEIYVDAIHLANCKLASRDCNTLARMLLTEVFSRDALSVCSLTGKVEDFKIAVNVSYGLNEFAKAVLFTFVKNYGHKNNWTPFDMKSVVSSLNSKIQEIQSKYGQTA